MTDLDRLAKAWFDFDSRHLGGYEAKPWEEQSEGFREGFRNDLRGLLEAMREPSTGMVLAGRQAANSAPESFDEAEAAFTAMIDHILKETP